ncbi:MAG: alpha/beta hydrolase [Gemmatimonadetes bacterium]|nr:alpha/beta hydrolase [Gemmatimonadota bacterium]
MRELLALLVVLYVGFAATAYFLADRLIFLPPPSSYAAGDLPIRMVPGENGASIATLHLPDPAADFTILYSHGNAEDLGHLYGLLQEVQRAGFAVLAYDYRGYGLSSGGPATAEGAYRDLHAVYRHAVEDLRITPGRLILLGRSVGSGPATELAAREAVGGLILESAFTSAFRVVTRVQLLPFDRFPNLRHIRNVTSPVLVIHGKRDEVIAAWHGQRLFDAAREPKRLVWIERAGHNDLLIVAGASYWSSLRAFADLVQQHQASRPR